MTELASQIEEIRSEMGRTTSQILNIVEKATLEVRRVSERSVAIIKEAVIAGAIREQRLHARLARLELMAKLEESDGVETGADGRRAVHQPSGDFLSQPKRSASDIILFKLAMSRSPVPTSDLDSVVVGEGLTKAAAEKAKYHLKKDGLASAVKRRWSITPEGRRKLNGHHPSGGP